MKFKFPFFIITIIFFFRVVAGEWDEKHSLQSHI